MELDDDEEAVIVIQASPSKHKNPGDFNRANKEFEMLNGAPSFMDSN